MRHLFILSFLFSINQVVCQTHEVSFNLGYGSSEHRKILNGSSNFPLFVASPDDGGGNSLIIEGNYHYKFHKSKPTGLNTGLQYHHGFNSEDLRQLIVPLGVSFDYGERFHFFFGAGLLVKFTIHSSVYSDRVYKKGQLGSYYNLGCGYRISDRVDVQLGYQLNMDITEFYIEYKIGLCGACPGATLIKKHYKEYKGIFQLGLSYTFKGKE